MSLELDEEELKRLLDEGSASGQPMQHANDLAELKASLAVQGQNMTPGMGEDLPRGTKVNFAPPEQLDVAAPPVSAAARQPIVPKVVDLTNQSPDDLEMAFAAAQDRKARASEAFERGSRQLVGALTRTKPLDSTPVPVDAVQKLLAARQRRDADAQRNEQNRLGAAKFNFDQSEAVRKAAEAKAQDTRDFTEKQKEFAYRQEHDKEALEQQKDNADATRKMAGAGLGLRIDEAARKKKEDADKDAASNIPFLGGTLKLKPGLSDTERAEARRTAGDWNAADESVGNFQTELEKYARNPSIANKGNVTAALRTASSSFNKAIGSGAMSMDEAKAMSEAMGADVLSPTGVEALAQSIFGDDPAKAASTITGRVVAARRANRVAAQAKLRASGDYSEPGGEPSKPTGHIKKPAAKPTTEDDAAMKWARANPDDPRAKKILEMHGAQ